MEYSPDIFGKTVHLTAEEGLRQLELAISEGLLDPAAARLTSGVANLFGRQPLVSAGRDLSFVAGLVATGLRAAAFASPEDLERNADRLRSISGQLLPLVIHLSGHRGEQAEGEGFFRLFAANAQEAIDLAIIAHRVAELSLIPGIVVFAEGGRGAVAMPSERELRSFLGDSDEAVASPTPSQQILFGKNRRRVPNWFNFDFPSLNGVRKKGKERSFDLAARRQYFYRHFPELLEETMEEYAGLTGRRYAVIGDYQSGNADFLVLTRGGAVEALREVVDELRSREKAKVGCLNLRVAAPFPREELAALAAGKKKISVLEPLAENPKSFRSSLFQEVEAAIAPLGKKAPALLEGFYGEAFSPAAGRAVFQNMMKGGQEQPRFFVDIEFTRNRPGSPQQEVLLQSIARAYPGIEKETLLSFGQPAPDAGGQKVVQGIPSAIRRFQDQGPPYTRLSRFYHDTASFYASGRKEELVADPFQALEVIPAATAPLAGLAASRSSLPVFHPEKCTACGQCVVYCPHGALPPVVLGVEALIRGAMNIAAQQGTPTTQLTPLVKNLARAAATAIGKAEQPVTRAADFLDDAFGKVAGAMSLTEEKVTSLRQEWDTILTIIGNFPVAITQTFFTEGERREKGQGELFSLAVDVAACTGCGVCAQICDDGALVMAPQDQGLVDRLQQTFGLWEQLPDTSAETINRMVHDPEYDPLAGVLLSRNYYHSMTGGSATEEGASAKAVLHLVTALTESAVQPRMVRQSKKIGELIEQLSENIHAKLSDALPRDNFRSLLESVDEAGGDRLPLDEVVSRLATREHLQLVDTHSLQRKIELVNDLKEMRWSLTAGPTGTGRARFGMVLAPGKWPWVDNYPYNVFLSPVLADSSLVSAELLAGLFQGHIRHLTDNIKLLRRAKLEAKDKYRPEIHDQQIAGLRWEDLEDEEKELIPPLLMVADGRFFGEIPSWELQSLLASPWPVKVVVIDDAHLPPAENPEVHLSQAPAAMLSAVTLGTVFVAQGVTARPHALFAGLRDGLHRPGPALFRLLAPEGADRSGHPATWPALARLALESRAFPAFIFDPEGDRESLSAGFSMAANPEPQVGWVASRLDGQDRDYVLTYADWLFTLPAWQDHFMPLAEGEGSVISLAAFLDLSPDGQKGKIPVITAADANGDLRDWRVSAKVVAATRAAARRWRILREMAGTFTPFPQKLRAAVEQELLEKHEGAMASLRQEYEEKLHNQEQILMQEVKIRLREKLLDLSQRKI